MSMHHSSPPYDKQDELQDATASQAQYLPGQPRISLTSNLDELYSYLNEDLSTPDLDTMAPHLWLMSTKSHANISPLHHQIVKGRKIILTEDPQLHLVWIDDRIFIKPLPRYLLSHDFWLQYLTPLATNTLSDLKAPYSPLHAHDAQKVILIASALGLLRSYRYLIKYSSDLDLAIQTALLPPSTTYEAFCAFSIRFQDMLDEDVRPRYHYGELRLSRLNFWAKFLLGRWYYAKIHHQYRQYFQRFYGPLPFVFGFLSLALSAMQVESNVEDQVAAGWPAFDIFSRVFSVLTQVLLALTGLALLFLLSRKLLLELVYAVIHR